MSEDVKKLTGRARFRDSESLRFLHTVCSRVPSQRVQALENVARVFDGWLEGYGSPQDTVLIDCAAGENNVMPTDYKCMIREQLPDLLRLSTNAPFVDVRERCNNILQDLQVNMSLCCDMSLCLLVYKKKQEWSAIAHGLFIPKRSTPSCGKQVL